MTQEMSQPDHNELDDAFVVDEIGTATSGLEVVVPIVVMDEGESGSHDDQEAAPLTNNPRRAHHGEQISAEKRHVKARTSPPVILTAATLLAGGCLAALIWSTYTSGEGSSQIVGPVAAVAGLGLTIGSIAAAVTPVIDLRGEEDPKPNGAQRPTRSRQ